VHNPLSSGWLNTSYRLDSKLPPTFQTRRKHQADQSISQLQVADYGDILCGGGGTFYNDARVAVVAAPMKQPLDEDDQIAESAVELNPD
jgi:hypothetical protein